MDNELLAELEGLLPAAALPGDGAYTTRELASATGKGPAWVREALREAIRLNKWEVTRIKRVNLGGVTQSAIAYRPIPKRKKK